MNTLLFILIIFCIITAIPMMLIILSTIKYCSKKQLRIIERTSSVAYHKYYIVQYKTLFGWKNLWLEYKTNHNGWITYDRTFDTIEEAENAIKQWEFVNRKDKVVKEYK